MAEVLIYINKVCENADGTYEYDFVFSSTPDDVWGNDWDVYNPSSCNNMYPDETTISSTYRVKTNLPLKLIQETTYYPIEYSIYGIVAIGWIDIENLEEYPENGRMSMHFGDSYEKVESLLSKYDFYLEKN